MSPEIRAAAVAVLESFDAATAAWKITHEAQREADRLDRECNDLKGILRKHLGNESNWETDEEKVVIGDRLIRIAKGYTKGGGVFISYVHADPPAPAPDTVREMKERVVSIQSNYYTVEITETRTSREGAVTKSWMEDRKYAPDVLDPSDIIGQMMDHELRVHDKQTWTGENVLPQNIRRPGAVEVDDHLRGMARVSNLPKEDCQKLEDAADILARVPMHDFPATRALIDDLKTDDEPSSDHLAAVLEKELERRVKEREMHLAPMTRVEEIVVDDRYRTVPASSIEPSAADAAFEVYKDSSGHGTFEAPPSGAPAEPCPVCGEPMHDNDCR